MATYYDYVMAVWLKLETTAQEAAFLEELHQYLEAEYQVRELGVVDDPEDESEGERTVSLILQLTFDQSEMVGDEPTEEAISKFDVELRRYLEDKYRVNHLDVLDDGLTSFLLAEHEEPEAQGEEADTT